MKSYHSLALKELLTQKVTSILTLIAIVLSTVLTTAVGQSVGILAAMREQQAITIGGNSYARLVQLDEEQVNALQNDKRISYIGLSMDLGSLELKNGLELGLSEYLGDSLESYPSLSSIKEGRLPKSMMEIALPEDVLQLLGFTGKVGDSIIIEASKALRHGIKLEEFNFCKEFILTGIIKNNYLGYTTSSVQGIVGAGTVQSVLPESYVYYNVDLRTKEKITFQSTIDNIVENLNIHELDIMYNTIYLDALGIPFKTEVANADVSDTGFSFMMMAGTIVVVLIMFAAGLVIFNILKIAVARSIKHYGTLRAIGAEKRQLYSIVVEEILILCIIGIPIGMLFGYLSAKGILIAATNQLNPDIFLVQDTAKLNELIAENSSGKGFFLFASAAITLFSSFIATIPAANFAAKVSPIVAMSGANIKIKRRKRNVKKIRNFEKYYARLNLNRNLGRTIITVLSLVMSITVFITLQGFVSLLSMDTSDENRMGDYSIINEGIGLSPDILRTLEIDENVVSVAALQYMEYLQNDKGKLDGISLNFDLQPGESFQVVGLNNIYLENYFSSRLSEEQINTLKTGKGCIVRNPIPLVIEGEETFNTNIQAGSSIIINKKELLAIETMEGYDGYFSVGDNGFVNGIQVIVSDSLYTEITGVSNYSEVIPTLKEVANREAFNDIIDNICEEVPGTTCISYEQVDKQLEESASQIHLLAWGLILFIGLIGILNIINTVYTNIHTRVAEIGTQRAIGMSIKSLYKTFIWEGIYYGVSAAVIGSLAGYFCTVFMEAAATNELKIIMPPIFSFIEATIISVIACLLATCIPLRKISLVSIVEAIENVE